MVLGRQGGGVVGGGGGGFFRLFEQFLNVFDFVDYFYVYIGFVKMEKCFIYVLFLFDEENDFLQKIVFFFYDVMGYLDCKLFIIYYSIIRIILYGFGCGLICNIYRKFVLNI